MNFNEINEIIQGAGGILESEFINNNIKKANQQNKYACISCSSSDGLHLYSDTNTCHCYSCGQTWNVVSFLMTVQGVNYIEAIKYLNNTYNLNLPINNTKEQNKEQINLNKRLKTYKENEIKKLDEEYKEYKQAYNNAVEVIRINKEINERDKEELEQTMFSLLFENHCKIKHQKEYIESLTLNDIDINELLNIKVVHPAQQQFINDKLNLLYKSNIQNKDEFKKHIENLKTNEYINYSKYKASETVYIDRYIGENNIFDKLLKYKRSLGISPTGSGKTKTLLEMFKEMEKLLEKMGKKVCFVVPNAIQVAQIQEEYGIKGAWNKADKDLIFMNNTISCYTWNKFGDIEEDLSNTIVILDETHQIYQDMYRKNTIDKVLLNISKCSNVIDITATPNKLGFANYDYIIEYKQTQQTNYNVNLYENIDDDKIINIINNSSGKVSVLKDDIEYLKVLQNRINKKSDLIYSDNKDENITYKNIVKKGKLIDINVILHTSLFVAGLNINEPDMTDIIIIGVKDIATIRQYVARYRNLENVNVHIFNTYKEVSKVWNIEKRIEYEIKKVQEACNNFNKDRLEGFETEFIEDTSIFKGLNKDLYIYKHNGIYKVDEISIRHKIYSNYYKNADIVSFKNLLEEHFNNITIVTNAKIENKEMKEEQKQAKKTSKEYLEELEKHSHHIVGYHEIKKGNDNNKINEYLKANKLTKEKVIKYIDKNNLAPMLDDVKVKKKLKSFDKLVLEVGYPTSLAYKLNNMHNKTRDNLYQKINVLLYEEILKECKGFMEIDTPQIKLYNFILDEMPISTTYDDDLINEIIKNLEEQYSIKLSNKKFKDYLSYVYIIESKRICIKNNLRPKLNYINKENIHSTMDVKSKEARKRVYKILDYHTLDSICKEYKLNDLDKGYLNNKINEKLNIIKQRKEKIKEHLTVFN